MVNIHLIYLIYFIWLSLPENKSGLYSIHANLHVKAELLVPESKIIAGDSIGVKAKLTGNNHSNELYLFVSHSWGVTTLRSDVVNNECRFLIDRSITNKAGDINLTLYQDGIMLDTKSIDIQPALTKSPEIESYHGPRSIKAGGEEYSMVIGTLLDSLDNPYNAGIKLDYNFMNGSMYYSEEARMKELFSYVNFYSSVNPGKVLAHITHGESGSTQRSINVVASDPENFKLNHERIFPYANSTEPVRLFTSTIRDRYGNIVADGTLVEFIVNGSDNSKIVASGMTINGMAEVELPAPIKTVKWKIQAFITAFSYSKVIQLYWSSAIEQLPASYNEDSKILIVGPLKSRFNNLMPDGTVVNVTYKDQTDTLEYFVGARSGMAIIDLSNHDMQSGLYSLNIESCGLEIKLENNQSK